MHACRCIIIHAWDEIDMIMSIGRVYLGNLALNANLLLSCAFDTMITQLYY